MTFDDRPYRLAACAELMFPDLALVERVERLHELGYGVELWGWRGKDIAAIARTGADILGYTGHLAGSLVDPAATDLFLEGARESLEVADQLRCRRLVLHMTEIASGGVVVTPTSERTGSMWFTAHRTLLELAALAERHDVTYLVENLNTSVDHPGAPLSRARDVIDLVAAVDSPRIQVLLDLYHAQVDEGNLIELVRAARPWLGEIQLADVPGRHEPGTGEINFRAIARELRATDFAGVVGLEAVPTSSSLEALEAFSTIF